METKRKQHQLGWAAVRAEMAREALALCVLTLGELLQEDYGFTAEEAGDFCRVLVGRMSEKAEENSREVNDGPV